MAINKVDFGGRTLIDLTGDTLTDAAQLLNGITAHSRDGSQITGTFRSQTKTATPSTSTQSITPSAGRWLSKVTVDPIPSNFVDLNTLKLHCTEYNEGSFETPGVLLENITITCGFRPKVFYIRTATAIRTKTMGPPYNLVASVSIWDDDADTADVRGSVIMYYDKRSQWTNLPATASYTGGNRFNQTATGVQGYGSAVKTHSNESDEGIRYLWYAWGV